MENARSIKALAMRLPMFVGINRTYRGLALAVAHTKDLSGDLPKRGGDFGEAFWGYHKTKRL